MTGGDHGPLTTAFRRGGSAEARRTLQRLVHIFGRGNIYVELQRHFDRDEESINHRAIELAREFQASPSRHQRCAPCHAQRRAKYSMSSPACAITARWKPPDDCSPAMPSVSEIAEGNGGSLPRSPRSHRQHQRAVFIDRAGLKGRRWAARACRRRTATSSSTRARRRRATSASSSSAAGPRVRERFGVELREEIVYLGDVD